MPALAFAILIVAAGAVLALDRLWIDATQTELRRVAEASALAAADEFLTDERLKPNYQVTRHYDAAKQAAEQIAVENHVAGEPLQLDVSDSGDVRFGRLTESEDPKIPAFVETDIDPHGVIVLAERNRRRGNPMALFFRNLSGHHFDAAEMALATYDNRIIGLRPLEGIPVPALPLGIDQVSWNEAIEQAQGRDEFRFNPETNEVDYSADQLPEMTLIFESNQTQDSTTNSYWLQLCDATTAETIATQIEQGLVESDLTRVDGQIRVDREPQIVPRLAATVGHQACGELIGQQRIVLLGNCGNGSDFEVHAIAAIRIMAVDQTSDADIQLIVQPTVMTTRTALTYSAPLWSDEGQRFRNRYIYDLFLSL